MNPELLQQLRDIHLPTAPGWWPPAIGWWLLATLAVALVTWLTLRFAARWRRFRPARAAQRLYRALVMELRAGRISPAQYVHQANELLKRLARISHQMAAADAGTSPKPGRTARNGLGASPGSPAAPSRTREQAGRQLDTISAASGDRWLRYLDERFGQAAFSRGTGRSLGNERFRPDFAVDTEALDGLLRRFLARERRRFWRLTRH